MTIQERAVELYRSVHSIKGVSESLQISEQVARRYLINAGEYTNDRIRAILSMYEDGKSVEEICKEFGIKKSAVHSSLPYTKGTYKDTPSKNAVNIRKCREKIKGGRG